LLNETFATVNDINTVQNKIAAQINIDPDTGEEGDMDV